MIIAVKKSKLKKLNTRFFTVVKISMEKEGKGEVTLPYLLPPASILIPRRNGNLSKKKFIKKYRNYLEESGCAQLMIFNIVKSLKLKNLLCFTCTDDEYDLGYIQELVSYLSDTFGVEVTTIKDANASIDSALSDYTKKDKKLIKADPSELSNKKAEKRIKIIRAVKKFLASPGNMNGEEEFDKLDNKFAIQQVIEASVSSKACKYNGDDIVDINEDKMGKKSIYIKAIKKTTGSSKKYKKIANKVASQYGLELNKKTLDKLTKSQLLTLVSEIAKKINEYHFNEYGAQDSEN